MDADGDHAEGFAFGGAQCTHRGGAVDSDTGGEGEEDFLVPDGADLLVVAVDESDRCSAVGDGALEIAHLAGPRTTTSPGSNSAPWRLGPAKTIFIAAPPRRNFASRGAS